MLIKLDEVKKAFGIDENDQDSAILQAMKSVESEVKNRCGRDFESAERTEYYDGDGTDELIVKEYPITAISSVYDDTDRVYGASTAIPVADLVYGENNGISAGIIDYTEGVFMAGTKNIKITYTAGFTADGVPADLRMALIKLVGADYLESRGAIFAIASEGADGVAADRPGRLRKQAWQVINRYRSRSI